MAKAMPMRKKMSVCGSSFPAKAWNIEPRAMISQSCTVLYFTSVPILNTVTMKMNSMRSPGRMTFERYTL